MQSNAHSNRYTVRNMHLVPPTVVGIFHGIFRRPSNDNVAYLRRNPSAHAHDYPTLRRAPSAHSVNNYPTLKRAISAHAAKPAANRAANNSVKEEPELDNSVEDERKQLCVVCFDQTRNCIILPCKHFCMCIECAKQVQREFNKCPICRTPIKEIVDTSLWTAEKLKNTTKFTGLPYIVNLYS